MKNTIIIPVIFLLLAISACSNEPEHADNSCLIASFEDFVGEKKIIGDNSLFGGGIFYFPVNIANEDIDFISKIKVKEIGSFGLCRNNNSGFGTVVLISKDSIRVCKLLNNSLMTVYLEALPFSIKKNQDYVIRMYKQNKDVYVSILDGENLYLNKFRYDLENDFGRNWGYPAVFCSEGEIEIIDSYLSDNKLNNTLKVIGDSFVEGWGIIDSLEYRYIALFQQLIGKDKLEISGRGGETTSSVSERFLFEIQKSDSKYILIALGQNDASAELFNINIKNIIKMCKKKKPLLITIAPRVGFPIIEKNKIIRSLGYNFLDLNLAINNGFETDWNSEYVNPDNVHPNVAGNQRIFNRMLFDFHFLYTTFDIIKFYKCN